MDCFAVQPQTASNSARGGRLTTQHSSDGFARREPCRTDRLQWALALCCLLVPQAMSHAHAQRSGQERRVDAPLSEPLPRVLASPQVAFGADQYLVVWVEQRFGGGEQQINQVLGARV